jgi:hypothetical protein
MRVTTRLRWLVLCLFVLPSAAAAAASDPVLFRLFLTDGTSLVSYGEFARVDDRVVFVTACAPCIFACRTLRQTGLRMKSHHVA